MQIIMAGAPWRGFRFFGPFADSDEAEQYQQRYLFAEDFWWIMPLEKEV